MAWSLDDLGQRVVKLEEKLKELEKRLAEAERRDKGPDGSTPPSRP